MDRISTITRTTKETDVAVTLNLDGSGQSSIQTGIGYFDHMLEQISFHGLFDLTIKSKGDLHVDCHHTVEDIGISLGQSLHQALGEKKGIIRYAHAYIPMDETLVRVVLDCSGRPDFCFQGTFVQPMIGQLDTQMISHFFKSIAIHAKITLHMSILYGENDHHKCEGLFKAFARALSNATQIDPRRKEISSTKGIL